MSAGEVGMVMSTSSLNAAGLSASSQRATSSGRITGDWLRTVPLPTARGLGRGYDRKAVDAMLLQCANGVDWLNSLLIGAENEIDRLTEGAPERLAIRSSARALVIGSHGKRTTQVKAAVKRSRLRTPASGRVRP